MYNLDEIVHVEVSVPVSKMGAFYIAVGELFGGTSPVGLLSGDKREIRGAIVPRAETLDRSMFKGDENSARDAVEAVAAAAPSTQDVETPDRPDVDADGHPFDPALHTGTLTKAGLWRMKAGVARPEPMPGFSDNLLATSTTNTGTESQAAGIAQSEPATSMDEDDQDEFAAFRKASEKVSAVEQKAAAEVPARKWADGDLALLCNQAATKLGDPAPVKAIIQQFVPEGEVPHSRNIPVESREAFASAVEAKAGIVFAG